MRMIALLQRYTHYIIINSFDYITNQRSIFLFQVSRSTSNTVSVLHEKGKDSHCQYFHIKKVLIVVDGFQPVRRVTGSRFLKECP